MKRSRFNYQPTAADDWEQPRLGGMPRAEMGGRRLIPGMEIGRPYTESNAPLFATDPAFTKQLIDLPALVELGGNLSEYGDCHDLVRER